MSFFCHKSHTFFSAVFCFIYIVASLFLPTKEMQVLCAMNIGATGTIIYAPYILREKRFKKKETSFSVVTLVFSLAICIQTKVGVNLLDADKHLLESIDSNFAIQSIALTAFAAVIACKATKQFYSDFQFMKAAI